MWCFFTPYAMTSLPLREPWLTSNTAGTRTWESMEMDLPARERESKTRFAHRRPSRNNHEVLFLEAGRKRVQSSKACSDAGYDQVAMLDSFSLF